MELASINVTGLSCLEYDGCRGDNGAEEKARLGGVSTNSKSTEKIHAGERERGEGMVIFGDCLVINGLINQSINSEERRGLLSEVKIVREEKRFFCSSVFAIIIIISTCT